MLQKDYRKLHFLFLAFTTRAVTKKFTKICTIFFANKREKQIRGRKRKIIFGNRNIYCFFYEENHIYCGLRISRFFQNPCRFPVIRHLFQGSCTCFYRSILQFLPVNIYYKPFCGFFQGKRRIFSQFYFNRKNLCILDYVN